MKSLERVKAILNNEPFDRPALLAPVSAATFDSCKQLGLSFNQVHLDSDKAAALAGFSYEHLGFDSVMPYFSIVLEGAALGALVDWGDDYTMPSIRGALYSDPEEFKLPADFLARKPIVALLESLSLLRRRYGGQAMIIGKVLGPWTLALHLCGMEQFLIGTLTEPQKTKAFLEQFTQVTKLFARAQLEAGADMITLADHITADLASPATYLEFLKPLHQEIIQSFADQTFILHCCGNTTDRIEYFAEAGFPVFHFDSKNEVELAREKAGAMQLTGYLNNIETLLMGTPADVEKEAREVIAAGIRLVSPECALPLQVKNENLLAIARTIRGENV